MPITTSTLLVSSIAPSSFEDNVVFTATVLGVSSFPGGPTGSVSFYDGTFPGSPPLIGTVTLVGLTGTSGMAQIQISSLTAGLHTLTAVYSGDPNFGGSSNIFAQQVNSAAVGGGTLPGFALIAKYSPLGDTALAPQATLYAVPSNALPHQSVTLLWDTLNVYYVRIKGSNGVDYIGAGPLPTSPTGFDTGLLSTSGAGLYVVPAGFTLSLTLLLTAYDASQNPIVGLTSSLAIIIT